MYLVDNILYDGSTENSASIINLLEKENKYEYFIYYSNQ